jgi:hypothetical protein
LFMPVTAASLESEKGSGEGLIAEEEGMWTKLFHPYIFSSSGKKSQRIKFTRTHYIRWLTKFLLMPLKPWVSLWIWDGH